MWRRVVCLALLAALAIAVPASAGAGKISTCRYDSSIFFGIGCSQEDMTMIALRTAMTLADATRNVEAYWDLQYQAGLLQRDASLTLDPLEPLSSYRVLDSVAAGANIRFATVPTLNGPRLVITDRLGRRPVRITAAHTIGWWVRPVDWIQSFTWGYVIEDPGIALLDGRSSDMAAAVKGGITTKFAYTVDGASAKALTEYQVDVLHTDPKGNRTIYRKKVRIAPAGRITVLENDRPWSYVREVMPGEGW